MEGRCRNRISGKLQGLPAGRSVFRTAGLALAGRFAAKFGAVQGGVDDIFGAVSGAFLERRCDSRADAAPRCPGTARADQLLQHQADETDSAAFALWATHDTTILVMLVALGLWDGQWPPYTDTLVLEVYKELKQQGSQRGGRAFVRLLHGSTVLHLPWCKVHETIPGLCSVESFLPPAIERFRDMKAYRRACNASNLFSATPAFPVEQSVTCGLPSAGVLMFSVLSFVAGCQFKAWQRSRPDSEADYVVLSPQPP